MVWKDHGKSEVIADKTFSESLVTEQNMDMWSIGALEEQES